MSGIWREPAEESVRLYPSFVVDDGRMSGSITLGRTRLPLWAIVVELCADGWDAVAESYGPPADVSGDDVAGLLYHLCEARGEFARLLLVLADVDRVEQHRRETRINVRPWWEHDVSRRRVVNQLRRCIAVLEDQS